MALKNPVDTIKDVVVTSLKVPVTVAGAVVGVARNATSRAAGTATSLLDHDISRDTAPADSTPSPTEPVNVVDELGLDPAPVEPPKPARTPAEEPATRIDAAADPSQVDATPADVAKALGQE